LILGARGPPKQLFETPASTPNKLYKRERQIGTLVESLISFFNTLFFVFLKKIFEKALFRQFN